MDNSFKDRISAVFKAAARPTAIVGAASLATVFVSGGSLAAYAAIPVAVGCTFIGAVSAGTKIWNDNHHPSNK